MPVYRFGDMLVDPQKYPWGYTSGRLLFNGSDSYVLPRNIIDFDHWKVQVKFIVANITDSRNTILYRQSGGIINVQVREQTIYFFHADPSNNRIYGSTGNVISSGIEYALGVEYDRTENEVYVTLNNNPISVTYDLKNSGIGVCTLEHPPIIGAADDSGYTNPGRWFFDGKIWDLFVYNNGDLHANWPMQEGTGPIVYDKSENESHGTIANAIWEPI